MTNLRALYTSKGEWVGLYANGMLYNTAGEWIGFLAGGNEVYSVSGEYVGWMTQDFRLLRKREMEPRARLAPPSNPGRINPPATVPLPPLMAELGFDTVDVFDEMPGRLHTVDFDQARQDMD